jgi:hypothetical protein
MLKVLTIAYSYGVLNVRFKAFECQQMSTAWHLLNIRFYKVLRSIKKWKPKNTADRYIDRPIIKNENAGERLKGGDFTPEFITQYGYQTRRK